MSKRDTIFQFIDKVAALRISLYTIIDNPAYIKEDQAFGWAMQSIERELRAFESALRAKLNDTTLGGAEYFHAEDILRKKENS